MGVKQSKDTEYSEYSEYSLRKIHAELVKIYLSNMELTTMIEILEGDIRQLEKKVPIKPLREKDWDKTYDKVVENATISFGVNALLPLTGLETTGSHTIEETIALNMSALTSMYTVNNDLCEKIYELEFEKVQLERAVDEEKNSLLPLPSLPSLQLKEDSTFDNRVIRLYSYNTLLIKKHKGDIKASKTELEHNIRYLNDLMIKYQDSKSLYIILYSTKIDLEVQLALLTSFPFDNGELFAKVFLTAEPTSV
jgi:hypothetical protein